MNIHPKAVAWSAFAAVGLVYELREVRAGDRGFPASRGLRWLFRTDTRPGAVAFVLVVEGGSVILCRHIVKRGNRLVGDVLDPQHG